MARKCGYVIVTVAGNTNQIVRDIFNFTVTDFDSYVLRADVTDDGRIIVPVDVSGVSAHKTLTSIENYISNLNGVTGTQLIKIQQFHPRATHQKNNPDNPWG
jgi:hypothetical protein